MDEFLRTGTPHPSVFIDLIMYVLFSMIWRGYRRTLQFDDVYKLLDVHRSEEIISIFGSEWDKKVEIWRRSHPEQQE